MYTGNVGATRSHDDPITIYLREACALPPLARGEEIELSQRLFAHDQQAESAGKRLVEANLAMVVSIAEAHLDSGIHALDLIQVGNDGLMLALKTFPVDGGESFSVHATACVKDAIEKALARPRATSS